MSLLPSAPPLSSHSLYGNTGEYVVFVSAGMPIYKEHHLADPIEIGRGGMGNVIKYYNKKLAHEVVVKKTNRSSMEDRFVKEIRTHFRNGSAHLNIVKVLGTVEFEDSTKGLVLEYLEEGTLDQVIRPVPSPSTNLINQYVYDIGHIISWISEITSAVRFIHSLNVMHLDLKPLNILMHRNRQSIKLADFGLSRYVNEEISKPEGTPAWMSPEAFNGKPVLKSDVYSLAFVLWQMIYRSKPYPNVQGIQLLLYVTKERRPEITVDCHPILVDIMKSCWCTDIDQRWDSAHLLSVLSDLKYKMPRVNNPVEMFQNHELVMPYRTRIQPDSGQEQGSTNLSNSARGTYSFNIISQEVREHPIESAPPLLEATAPVDDSSLTVSPSDLSHPSSNSASFVAIGNRDFDPNNSVKGEVIQDISGREDNLYLRVRRLHNPNTSQKQICSFCRSSQPSTAGRDFLAVGDNTGVMIYDLKGSESREDDTIRNKRLINFRNPEKCKIEKLVWNSQGTYVATIYREENEIKTIVRYLDPSLPLELQETFGGFAHFSWDYSPLIVAEFAPTEQDDCLAVVCQDDILFMKGLGPNQPIPNTDQHYRQTRMTYSAEHILRTNRIYTDNEPRLFCGFNQKGIVEFTQGDGLVSVDCEINLKKFIQGIGETTTPSCEYLRIPCSYGTYFILEEQHSINIVRLATYDELWEWEVLYQEVKEDERRYCIYSSAFIEGDADVSGACAAVIFDSKILFWYSKKESDRGTCFERDYPPDIGTPIHVEFHPKLAMFAVLTSSSFLVLFAIVDGIIRTYEKYQLPFRTNGRFSWNKDGKKIVVSCDSEVIVLVRYRKPKEEKTITASLTMRPVPPPKPTRIRISGRP